MDDKLTDTPSEGNVALSHLRDLLFGDYLSREGADGNCHQPPPESCTQKSTGRGKCTPRRSRCASARPLPGALAVWNNDTIDETSPILSATLPTGERCQIVVPPACERNTISITLRKPDYFQRTHQSYIDAGFYDRVQGTEKVESKDGELSRIYLSGNIPLFMEKCVEYGKTLFVVGGNRLWENHLHEDAAALHSRDAAPYHHRGQPGAEVLQPEKLRSSVLPGGRRRGRNSHL